jgi:hypothetical protein
MAGHECDEKANAARGPCISREGIWVRTRVIPTEEGLMIALHTHQTLSGKEG